MNNVVEVLTHLEQLKGDVDASKRFKECTEEIIGILNRESELAVEKAILRLEELDSLEMSSYCRTQIWNIIGMLESTKN